MQKKTELTANFFRESESRYVYFVTDEKNNKAKIVSVEKDSPSEKNAAFGVFELTEEFRNLQKQSNAENFYLKHLDSNKEFWKMYL